MNNYNPFTLEGKTILVTGASSGIGRAIAIECSKMGAKLILTARNEQRLNETLSNLEGDGHQVISAELTNQEQLDNLVKLTPTIDGLVLCAGTTTLKTIKFASRENFDKVLSTNFYSQFELLRLLYKKKRLNRNASIIMMTSVAGITKFVAGSILYGVSKAALDTVMKYAAEELAPVYRVNAICPGMIDTPFIYLEDFTEEQMQKDIQRYPMKRYGKPEEVGYLAVYLLSDASAWVTGQNFFIDGGISIN